MAAPATKSLTVDGVVSENKEHCAASLQAFRRDIQKIRTGRASTSLIEGVTVDYYGSRQTLGHLCQMSTPEARLIVLQVYDTSAVSAIEKAIQSAGLGLNPSRDGNTLRIVVPALTEETRKDIVRHLHKLAEEMRVSVRNHRREANDQLKKLEKDGATKDDTKRGAEKIQKQTDSAIAEIDSLLKAKEAECLEV